MSTQLTPSMRRSILIAMLRDSSQWPEGFQWDFSWCQSCGMGLLMQSYQRAAGWHESTKVLTAELMGLSASQVEAVFSEPAPSYRNALAEEINRSYRAVTPEMVADRLETVHRELTDV